MTIQVADFSARLKKAMREARTVGLVDAADEAEARMSAAYATSSEWLGEVGSAIRHFLKREHGRVPPDVQRELERCLTEIHKVWPGL